MRYHKLGKSEIELTPVMIGTWALGGWLWGGTAHNDADGAIGRALDLGINAIDTAPAYGFGLSEELVGRSIKGRRDSVVIATKCGLVWDDRPGAADFFETTDNSGHPLTIKRCLRKKSILAECDASLLRLGIDTIDLYQCHWPDPGTPIEETIDAMMTLKDSGKIREFGVSNFSVKQLSEMVEMNATPASNQPKYSLLSREIEKDVLPYCHDHGISCLAYSSMEMGLLTGKFANDYVFPENDTRRNRPWFQPDKLKDVNEALKKIRPIAEKHSITLGQLAIAWVYHQPGITSAIVGCRNHQQGESNAAALNVRLTDDELTEIRSVFEYLKLDKQFDPSTARR